MEKSIYSTIALTFSALALAISAYSLGVANGTKKQIEKDQNSIVESALEKKVKTEPFEIYWDVTRNGDLDKVYGDSQGRTYVSFALENGEYSKPQRIEADYEFSTRGIIKVTARPFMGAPE